MNANSKIIIGILSGLIIGFGSGFFFTNSANRQKIESLETEVNRLKNAPQPEKDKLSAEEIREKIAAADSQPGNLGFQKNLAFALYAYSVSQNEKQFLPDIERLLRRAFQPATKDFELTATLGNVTFDLAQTGDKQKFAEAPALYEKALLINPKAVEVRTDLGLTYFFDEPSAPEQAIAEYEKSLKIEPQHEKTLQNLTSALIALKKNNEAEKSLLKLREVNPQNEAIADLQTQLAQAKLNGENK